MIQQNRENTLYSKSLQVSGPDACKFLQGQLSCDVSITPTYGAYCNIKGKIECFFHLTSQDDKLLMSMPDSMLDATLQELQKYAVFSKVELSIVKSNAERIAADEIQQGIPEIYPETKGKFFPHDLNLPKIGAVSFSKGCYRGQEIVARMEHRGNLKRHMQHFESNEQNLSPGKEIAIGDSCGRIVRLTYTGQNFQGLAVVNR